MTLAEAVGAADAAPAAAIGPAEIAAAWVRIEAAAAVTPGLAALVARRAGPAPPSPGAALPASLALAGAAAPRLALAGAAAPIPSARERAPASGCRARASLRCSRR